MSQVTCEERALKWVHVYAVGGGVFAAAAPIPGLTTAGLCAAEAHLVYWIARIYGERLSVEDATNAAAGLGLAGLGLKAVAMEACNLVPIAGWIVKGVIATGAVETIGRLIVDHFENKFPGRIYTQDPEVEAASQRR